VERTITSEFKVGDVVVLKSGGPNMTIDYIESGSDAKARCCWFSNNKQEFGLFRVEMLCLPGEQTG